jgi:glucose-1-phosphate adenylyltransferase
MHNAEVGRYSRVRRAIIGQNVRIPESSVIGYDIEADRAKGYTVTDSGIVVICNNEETFSKSARYSLSAG